jgi:hypothetical protein
MRVRREACHNGLAQLVKVVCKGDHFVARYAGVNEQHAGHTLHDSSVALQELALVGPYTLCYLF